MKVGKGSSFAYIIECFEEYNVSYLDIQNDAREIDKPLYFPHYELRCTQHFPKFLFAYGLGKEILSKRILSKLNETYEEAKDKRCKAYQLSSGNPYLPNWKWFYFLLKSYLDTLVKDIKEYTIYRLLAVYVASGFFLFFSVVPLSLFFVGLLLVDLMSCKLRPRNSEAEKEYINQAIIQNPQLESPEISKVILDKFELLKDQLLEEYPKFNEANILAFYRTKRIRRYNHYYTVKQFIFKMTVRSALLAKTSSLSQDYAEMKDAGQSNYRLQENGLTGMTRI
jgi:hypothetical protein